VTRDVLVDVGWLLGAGLVARLLADLLRVPEIVLLLAAGALLGPSVLDAIDIPLDALGAQLLFTLGVSAILFYGGLNLSLGVLRRAWVSIGMLALPGVVLTAVVTGAVAALVFDIPFQQGVLIGAVLAPTDPAILIPLFVGTRLRARVAQTVIAESALNDTIGAVFALALAGSIVSGESSFSGPAGDFAGEVALGAGVGLVAGVLLAFAISSSRVGIWRESSALAALAVVAVSYVGLDYAGGSGYLGAFLAGLVVGNMEMLGLDMHTDHRLDLEIGTRNLTDLVTMFVFVIVGANIPFDVLGDELLPELAVVAVLLLVARPLTVAACMLPDRRSRWTRAELTFVAWTRETGVVPAALVGVLVARGVPHEDLLASVVALAIIVTLLFQALPAPWLAERLGLLDVSDEHTETPEIVDESATASGVMRH
jgi:potassium/hydrogen antiporter